jgi:hypothetical protein
MKKHLAALAMTLALLTSAAAYAQTVHVQATIPFNFNIGSSAFPAGKYDIQSASNGEHVLYIRNLNSGEGSFLVQQPCESAHVASQSRLTFRHYGQQYFMAEVWVAGYSQGHEFRVGKREEEVARMFSKQETTLLASGK